MALKPQEFYNVVKSMTSSSEKPKSMEERIREKARQARQSNLLEQAKLDTFQQDSKDYETKLASLHQRYQSDTYVDPNEVKDILAHGKALENRAAAYETYLKDYAPDQKDALSTASAIKKSFTDQLTGLSGVQQFYGRFENKDDFQAYTDKKKREDYLINEYDLDAAKKEVDAAKKAWSAISGAYGKYVNNRNHYQVFGSDADKQKLKEYDDAKKRYETLAEEYRQAENLKRLASYDALTKNSDFALKSVAGDDALSRFLNMDEEARKNTDTWTKILGGITDGRGVLGSITDYFGLTHSDLNDMVDKYHSMTDDQRKVYNYLNNTKGSQAARDYLYDIGDDLSYRAAVQQQKELDSVLPDNWFGNTVGGALSFGNAFDSGVSGAISSLGEGIYQTFAQNDRVLNTSVSANRFGLDREEAGKVQKVLLDLAQTTGNMIPSIVVSTATGVPILGAGMMGVQAKGAAYNQAIKEGYSPSQAQTYSTMVGALEGGLSYALTGIGKGATKMFPALGKAIDGISNGFLRGLAAWGVEAAGEGLEEGLTEFFDPFLRNYVADADNKKGFLETLDDVNWKDVGYSAFLGALSGGFLEGTPAAMKAVSLPDATAEAFKTKYDTGNGYEGFSTRLFQDDTLLSAKVIELVKADDANGAIAALNKGLHNYRFAKEYARQHYGVTAASDIDKRIQTIETLKASIKAGKFNAQSAETALRKTSDIWQIAAENNDAVVDALTSGNLSNSKIEQKVLKDRGTINAFKRKTGVDLDGLSTISQKRQAVREASAGYQAFVQTDAYRTMQELTKANETEKDASKVVANKRSIIDGMLALHNQAMAEADSARRNGNNELADQKKMVARLADAALNSTRNDKASYFASNRSSAVDYDELSALGDQYLPSLSAEDRSTLTGVRSVADLKRSEVAVKEKLNKQRDEAVSKKAKRAVERQLQAVDAYFVSAMTSLQNVNDAALAEARTIVDERIKAMNKNLRRYGVTVEGFANGVRYFDTDGKEISYDEVLEKQRQGEAVRMNVVRGMNSERTLAIARDIASGVVPVMNPLNGQIVQMKVGRGEGMVSPERAVDIILAHEAVHYAEKYGQSGLVDSIIHKIAGTRLDTQYELANRLKNRPVSEAAAKNWDKLKNTYADVIAKERKISREEALSKVDDAYLYEEIAADYMGTLMANNSFAEALAAQDGNLFKRIVRAIRDLLEGLRNGGMVNHERAAKDLATRLEAIAKKTYGRMEKKVDASTSENAAESPVGNVPTEEGTNEGDTANEGDAQEKAGEGAETVMENAEGEVVGVDDGNGSTRFSIATYEDGGREALSSFLDSHVSDSDLSQEDADDILSSLDEIYDICLNFENDYAPFGQWSRAKVETDRDGNPVFSVVKSNGDYALNLDFSLVCKKRRALDAVFNRLIEMGKINTFDFGQEEIVRINDIIREHGFEVACALCFVDAKRFRQAKVADQFVTMYNGLVKSMDKNGVGIDYFNFGGDGSLAKVENGIDTRSDAELDFTKIDKVIAGGKKGTVIYKIAKHLTENPQDRRLLSRGDFMSSYGFGEVKKQNPAILSLYNSKKGNNGPKAAYGDVQYLNEIISKKKFNAEDAYDVGGVRIQSFSDYVARLVFDYAQMVADLAAKQLPAHAYTKEVLFAKQFGLTGIKINMSLIPSIGDGRYAGLNADGSYAWASESFPIEEAFRIQSDAAYGKNCGTIAVGVSDEHIRKMLADPQIRMVIPYHKSGINPIVAHMMNIKGFTDYTKEQNTRYRDGKKLNKADMSHVPDFNQMMHREGLDAVEASRRYVAWCEERGYRPKFDQFAYKTVDGKRVFNENYYKLLEDFTTMVDGEFHPQEAVRAVYPDESSAFGSMKELIRQGLEEDAITVGNLEADTDAMVEEISEVLAEGEKRYSVAGEESMDADFDQLNEAWRMYQNGENKNDIVKETGWWLGKDGKWRYEISDKDMKFELNGFVKNPKTVGDYVKHDKLFKAYPQLKDVRVAFVDKVGDSVTAKGRFTPNRSTIEIRRSLDADEAKKVMLHELQHAIQRIEGFKRGSSKKTGAMLAFNEVYDQLQDDPKFQRYSPDLKMKFIYVMTEQLMGAPLDVLARQNYQNDHGEIEAKMTVKRADMTEAELKDLPYFNDGIIADNDKVQKKFVDNLIAMGYNEKKANQIAEEGLRYDYQYEDGAELDVEGNFGHEGEGAGSRRSPLAGDYDGEIGRQRQVYGAREISDPDAVARKVGLRIERGRVNQEPSTRYSASGDVSMDEGTVGYEELKRQVAEQKEQIHRLTEEMVLSHGTHLDVKETGRFLKELLDRYGATLTVKDIEADVNDITEYLYRKYDVARDEQGRFVSKEKVKEIDAAKLNDRIQRLATRIMESSVDVDSRFEEYTSFLKTLHNTPIGITEEIKQAYGDGWGAFRQRNFGRLNLRNAETSDLSAFYQEMADNYPEILDSSISDPVEQLKQLADAAKTIRETGLEPKNIYGLDGESVVADIAYDFSSGISSIDPAMNFADKAQQKVKDAKAAGKQAVKTEGRRGDFRVAEQRLADDMYYGKKIAAIRERYEARLDEMAERFATKVKDRSEAQQVRYQKKMIEQRGKDLAKRLAKPTKAKHIPEDMVPDVYRLLDKIRWAAKTKFDQEVAAQVSSYLDAVKKRYPNSDDLKLPEGSGFSESLRSEIEAYDLGSMDDQNAQQLHGLNELLRRAIFEINAYDKVFHSGEKASVASLKARDQFRLARNEESKKGWVLLTRDRIIKAIDSIQDPEHFFTILNVPVLTEAFHNIGKSQDQYAKYIRTFANDLSDMVNDIYGDKGIPREVREDTQDYTTQSGKTLTFTTADLISFYLYTQQEDSLKCLKNPAGGIAFATTEKRSKVDGTVYQKIRGGRSRLTETDIANLNNILAKDTKAMEMAKRLSRFLNTTVSDVANKVSLETEGYRKYIIENYFPMLVYDENKTFDKIAGDAAAKVINYGFSKERTGLSGKTLLAGDVFTVVEKHATAVAQYAAYRKAILDFVKILNVRPDGQSNLRTDLKAFFGDKEDNRVIKFIDNFLSDLQLAQIKTGEDTLLSEKLLQRYKAAQVALNFSVIAKQPLSIIRAWPEFSAKGFAALMNPLAMGPKAWKAARDEMIEHSGLAQMKAWGFSENANANSFSQLYNKKGTQTWRSKTDDVSSFLAEEADMLTWARIWNACKAETNTIEETTEKFNEVIRKTQVVNTITTASRITQQGGIKSFLFAFKNEPIKSFNYFRSSLSDALMGKEGAKAKMAKVAVSSAISTIVTSAVSAAFWIGRDDEENTMEKFLDGWKENALEDLFNNTFIFFGDLVSVFQNYGTWDTVERMDMAGLTDLLQAIYGVVDVLQKDPQKQKNTGWKVTYDLVRALSNVTGLPVGNIARMARSISWTVADLSDDPMTKYGVEAFWYNAEGVSNATVRKRFKNILSDALDNKDYKGFAEVSTVLRTKGFNSQYIQDAIGESDVFYDAFNEGPEAFRNEVNEARKYDTTISSTSVMSAIKSRKTELVSDLYDAAKVGDKKAMQEVRDELLQLRDVETKQLLTDKDIDRLLKEKYEKQLKSDVKERLVDLYGTEVYETIKRVILSEYRKFGVTSEEIDRIARSLR